MAIESKRRLWRGGAGLCLAIWTSLASAQTQTGGAILSDTTWPASNSPYIVTTDLSIDNGATLTIEPGTVIRMGAGTGFAVKSGALNAKGTAALPIVWTSASDVAGGNPAAGNWGQLAFMAGTSGTTVVEQAQIRYGSGMRIDGASPTLNDVALQNNAGSAISVDLASSPSGAGLSASGNTLNGISVPAGVISGSVKWGLIGIPYVVAQGEVSVGAKPAIAAITPSSVQQGQTVNAVISGTRLAGVESIKFDVAGLSAIFSGGATDSSIPVQIVVPETQPLGKVGLSLQTAGGEVRYDTGITIGAPVPTVSVTSITPSSIRRSQSQLFQITGTHLDGAQVTVPSGAGLTLSNLQTSPTQATFNLETTATATLGPKTLSVTNAAIPDSVGAALLTINSAAPSLYVSPAPYSVAVDGAQHSLTISLTGIDSVADAINLSVADPTVASVSPASVTIPAGSTQASVKITGLKPGMTLLNLSSATLAPLSIQIYVSNPLVGTVVGPVLSRAIAVNVSDGMVGPIPSAAVRVTVSEGVPLSSKPVTVTVLNGGYISQPVRVIVTDAKPAVYSRPVGVNVTN